MGKATVIAAILIVIAIILAGIGALLMFSIVPKKAEEATFPSDFDDHFVYGGFIDKLNTGTGSIDSTNFTVDRHIKVDEKLDGGKLKIDEQVTAIVNGTNISIPDLAKHHVYNVDEKDLTLSYVTNHMGYEQNYTDADKVNWIFPHPVDKDDDFKIWNMNILNYSEAHYLGKEKRGGVECYIFRGEEVEYEIPLPESLKTSLGALGPGSRMTISLWEKAWVHPLSGTIVDFEKEIQQFLYLPPLPEIPEVVYPSDLDSTTVFNGSVTIFDPATSSFNSFPQVTVERNIAVTNSSGYDLTATETVTATAAGGIPLDALGSTVPVIFNSKTGEHSGLGRNGTYLFPLTGMEKTDYKIWDDGFGKQLTAKYMGMENTSFAPLKAYIYHVEEIKGAYAVGGVATLDMTYWVEPQTGIVLDANKKVWNWREQDARRLPADTDSINKTVTLNTTIDIINPLDQSLTSMEIYIEQVIECEGYTDATFSVAKITETMTKYLPNGTPMAPSVATKFGVKADTMEYVNVNGWSTEDRTGVFTFPVGILDDNGNVSTTYTLYNSDLMMSFPAVLDSQEDFNGREAAKYVMELTGIPLTLQQAIGAIGQDPGVPGAGYSYGCSFIYTVDIDTGTLLDLERNMDITIHPPTYDYLYDTLESTTVLQGTYGGNLITITQTLTGTDAGDGTTMINVTKTYEYPNGTDFLPPIEGGTLINTTSHQMLYANGTPTGMYMLFPANPTQMNSYPMMFTVGEHALISAAVKGGETGVAVWYNWTGQEIVDGGLFSANLAGVNVTMTLSHNYLVDKLTGSVLDTSAVLRLVNASIPMDETTTFTTTSTTQTSMQTSNAMVGWALSGADMTILSVQTVLSDNDVTAAVGKAAFTSPLLDIADGDEPALILDISFDEDTKASMVVKYEETMASLADLEALKGAHQMDGLLKSMNNRVAYVYYKQVWEDVDDNKGSVDYWGGFAKDKEDEYNFAAKTIPTILYLLAVLLIIVGVIFIIMDRRN